MARDYRIGWASRLMLIGVALSAGCRSVPLPKLPGGDIAAEKRDRDTVAIEQFETNRNFAEFQAARIAYERGDFRNSRAGLESLLRRVPRHRDARLLLAVVLSDQGEHAEALAQAQTTVDDFPNDPDAHRALGHLLEERNQHEDAWAHFDRAEKLAAQTNTALADRSLLAGTAPAKGMETSPGTSPGQNGPRTDLDPASSVVAASGIEAKDAGGLAPPTRQKSTMVMLDGCADRNDGVNGGGCPPAGPDAAGLVRQGEEALAAGDLERALVGFRQAVGLEPNNPHIPTLAAVAALRQNRPEVAVTVAQESRGRFPCWTPLLRTLGTAYYRQGDYLSSQLVLRQALSLDKSDALAYFLLGCTHDKLGQSGDAEVCFAEARRIDPSLAGQAPSRSHDSLR